MTPAPAPQPPADRPAGRTISWRGYLLLALASLVMFAPGQSRLPPVDRDESRYAQATSQMLQTGDFVDVRFQDAPRYLQPAGIYWLQSLSVSLLSSPGARQIWAYRVPSLISACIAVLLTGWIGAMLFGGQAGVVAALLMLSCALLGFEARMAKIDATLLVVTLAAQGALLRAYLGQETLLGLCSDAPSGLPLRSGGRGPSPHLRGDGEGGVPGGGVAEQPPPALRATSPAAQGRRRRGRRSVSTRAGRNRERLNAALFWVALGAGLMLKGPIILLVSGTTAAWLCVSDRRAAWLRRLHPAWGVVIMLAVAAPWFVAIGLKTHGGFFTKAVGHNLLGKIGRGEQAHGSPPGYYLALFSLTFWPGALAVVFALPWAWRTRRSPQVRFLTAWAAPTWVVYELIATKLPHYVLPTYPALACLAAGAATAAQGWPSGRIAKLSAGLYALVWTAVGSALAFAGAWLIWRYDHRLDRVALVLGVLAVGLMLGGLTLLALGRRRWGFGSTVGAAAVIYWGLYSHGLPGAANLWLSPRIAATVARLRPCPDSRLASSAFSEPSLVFLAGRGTRLVKTTEAADWLAADPACGLALVSSAQLPAFMAEAAVDRVRPLAIAEIDGVNYSKARPLKLMLFTAGPTAPASP